jgi:hypothetical protein
VFLQYSSRRREFIHAGIVVSVLASGRYTQHRSYVDVYSIEGDTDADGGRCGGRALRVWGVEQGGDQRLMAEVTRFARSHGRLGTAATSAPFATR